MEFDRALLKKIHDLPDDSLRDAILSVGKYGDRSRSRRGVFNGHGKNQIHGGIPYRGGSLPRGGGDRRRKYEGFDGSDP